jgi:hypothetical protein
MTRAPFDAVLTVTCTLWCVLACRARIYGICLRGNLFFDIIRQTLATTGRA